MNAIDTNVLVYAVDRRDPIKLTKARNLMRQVASPGAGTVVPWQVLGEFMQQLRRAEDQGVLNKGVVARYSTLVRRKYRIVLPTLDVVDHAIDLANRYSLSHWDSMLLGACKAAGVDTLYTEDMGSPITYDGLRLVNPFL